jgi:hypothetical protein
VPANLLAAADPGGGAVLVGVG